MHDIIDFYSNGCIQQFYDAFCDSHCQSECETLARFLSAIGIEIWRNVECFGGIYKGEYMVSNLSNVKRLYKNKHTKILKQFVKSCGYLYVVLSHNNKPQTVRVNRLVALTFYGESNEKLDACHANTNKLDNRLFNLDFKTHAENLKNPITQRKAKETLKAKATPTTAE